MAKRLHYSFAEVLQEDLLQASSEFYRLFPDYFEALVELSQHALRNKCTCFQRLLNLRVLSYLAEFIIYFGGRAIDEKVWLEGGLSQSYDFLAFSRRSIMNCATGISKAAVFVLERNALIAPG